MASLDNLMAVAGALAAFRFGSKGQIEESRTAEGTEFTDAILDLVSHVCVANMAIASMQSRGWENMTGMEGFYPLKGFTMVGLDWTLVCNDETGLVVANDRIDYDAVHAALDA